MPTTYHDGTELPADLQGWVFTIYTKDPGGANITNVGLIDRSSATITLSEGQKVYVGISASYIDVDGIQSDESEIAWSDNPVDCLNGVVFGIHNLKSPNKPFNLSP